MKNTFVVVLVLACILFTWLYVMYVPHTRPLIYVYYNVLVEETDEQICYHFPPATKLESDCRPKQKGVIR